MKSKNYSISPFAIPASIIIAGVIIAFTIFFTNTEKDSSSENSNSGQMENSNNELPEDFPAASVNIDDDPFLGDNSTAKIAIIEFSDYECPYSKRHFQEVFPLLISEYVDTGKAIYVYRDYPLEFHEPLASTEAIAAECIKEISGNKKYFEFHSTIFNTTSSNGDGIQKDQLYELASQIGVNEDKFKTCLDSEKYKEEVSKDHSDGINAGVDGTPGVIIGILDSNGHVSGKLINGAYPMESFKQVIDEYL